MPGLMIGGQAPTPPEGLDSVTKNSFEVVIPAFLQRLNPLFESPGKFMFGDNLSYADFWIGGMYVNNFTNPNIIWGKGEWEKLLDKFPNFK